ncbi:50S ribosomal protein L4 [Candidatus Woesearchaeota archaeon]|nr:50S ribosomal protein L4 [Candidatus Woesearchaeota archaeon]
MKLKILDTKASEKGSLEMPKQFNESFRPDLIKRAAVSVNSQLIQPYGAKPDAGMRASAEISRRRHNYKGSYGYGISRVPRKILSHRGNRFSWVAAVAPGTVGGRKAHAPKAEKVLIKDLNKKEKKKAMRCALSASVMKDVVAERGHKVSDNYPFVLSDEFESMTKTSELLKSLKSLGLTDELKRVSEKTIRAGKGKTRGRKYKRKVGPIIIVSQDCPLSNVTNIPGLDVMKVEDISALDLAPGMEPIRMALFTEGAVKKIKEGNLFA